MGLDLLPETSTRLKDRCVLVFRQGWVMIPHNEI
jgi:hypothetical protein